MNSSLKAFLIICGAAAVMFFAAAPFVLPQPQVVVKYKEQKLDCMVKDMPLNTEGYIVWNDVYGIPQSHKWYESNWGYSKVYINPGAQVHSSDWNIGPNFKIRRAENGYYLFSQSSMKYLETISKFQVSDISTLIEPVSTSLKDGN